MNVTGGIFALKKHILEFLMTGLLLVSFLFLSKETAQTVREKNQVFNEVSGETLQGVILVDAGHGGSDPGMVGKNGLEEKGINLQIAMKLKAELEKRNFTVIMTRESDKGLYEEDNRNQKAQDMQKRIAIIREQKPLLSVSIHQNSYEDSSVYGPQVFYYQDSAEGEKLAAAIQEKMNTGLEIARPRVAKSNKTYYLLKRSEGILAIVECGFLTNPSEAELLQTEEYQEKVAQTIAEGICVYLAEKSGEYS